MFNLLGGNGGYYFPSVANNGNLWQYLPDNTRANFVFTGVGNAPGISYLDIERQIGGAGPWSLFWTLEFNLTGVTPPPYQFDMPGYSTNTNYRVRWNHPGLGYMSPYYTFGPSTKIRWDVNTSPVAPYLIIGASVTGPQSVEVNVDEGQPNTDYTNKGIKISVTALVDNGSIQFPRTVEQYFSSTWASNNEFYTVIFPNTATVISVISVSAQFVVLGDPLSAGIVGAARNYP